MRAVMRELLATGITVTLIGCAGSPPPAVIQPSLPEAAPPPIVEVVPEPIVEAEPEPVRDPEPPLADRWRAPFAVSSSGRVITRSPRSVTVLASDPAIAAGMAAVNDAPAPAAPSRGATGSSTSSAAAAGGGSPPRSPASANVAVAGAPDAPVPGGASSRPATSVNRGATAPPPPISANRGATGSPTPSAAGRVTSTSPPPASASPGNLASTTGSSSGVRLIGDPIAPESGPGAASGSATTDRDVRGRGIAVAQAAASGGNRAASAIDAENEGNNRPGNPGRSVPGPSSGARTYTVESGDSWIGIARDHGVSFSQLQEANPDANPERIRIGQVLRIPPSATTTPTSTRSHRVGRGDTLSEIAERYGVSVRAIRAANDLSADVIRQGQVLTIPAE